ncbi:MAG: hypothetical protein MRZ54_04290 [Clostridiales bacterium]|nr:hypothetical protein [Clostridiales bacterium]
MKKIRILALSAGLIMGGIVCIFIFNNRLSNSKIISDKEIAITVLQYDGIIDLPDITENGMGFNGTGLTYDANRDSFWIGNYGKLVKSQKGKTPSIVQVSTDFKTVRSQIMIDDMKADIQGISYDENTDTLWYSNGECVINCTTDGSVIKQIDFAEYKKYKPNGVLFDNRTNRLWVLCFYNYLLNYDADGNLINSYRSDYIGQDHLCFNENRQLCFSVGCDYKGDENYVVVYSMETMTVERAYQVIGSHSIEGISIIGSNLYVINNGYYHNAHIKKNYVARYNIEN